MCQLYGHILGLFKVTRVEKEIGFPSSQSELRFPTEISDTILLLVALYRRESWSLTLREENLQKYGAEEGGGASVEWRERRLEKIA
jgi:hypothetical protein